MPISAITTALPMPEISGASPAAKPGAFESVLRDAISRVEQNRAASRASVDKFLSGEQEEIHQMVLNSQQAELSFELFLQVRNKVVQAYQEIMRMQV